MKYYGRAIALLIGGVLGLSTLIPTIAQAQECPELYAPDYAPVVDKQCGNWILQRMTHVDPRFGSHGWQIDDHGNQYILVQNYEKSTDSPNPEYFTTIDRALLVDNADLRVGKARPLRDDRVDADLERSSIGLYLELNYAEDQGMLPQ